MYNTEVWGPERGKGGITPYKTEQEVKALQCISMHGRSVKQCATIELYDKANGQDALRILAMYDTRLDISHFDSNGKLFTL